MLKVMILNGCKYLKHLAQGANAKYTSEWVIQEFLDVLANQIQDEAFDHVRESL